MKPARFIIAAMMLSAMLINSPAAAMAAGGKGGTNQRGGKAAEHMSDKGAANSNAQWSADPDRGWVRSDERHKVHEKDGASGARNQRDEKPKGKGKSNKY
jgi:hypothetical protein